MEPEGSLPQSQVPATCPYPEPDQSSSHPHIPLPEDPSEIPLHPRYYLQQDLKFILCKKLDCLFTFSAVDCHHNSSKPLATRKYTGCPRRNGPNFGIVFLRSNYTDITQNTYIQSSMVTEILAREKCGCLLCLRTVLCPWRHTRHMHLPSTR